MPKVKVAKQPSPRVLAARKNGALGGKARAAKHSKAEIAKWGAKGGNQTLALYGSDFFAHMPSKSKTSGRYKTPKPSK